jgi:hypothetical protein
MPGTPVQAFGPEHSGSLSSSLKEVTLKIVDRATCRQAVGGFNAALYGAVDASTVCAGEPESGGKDSCSGDSGGPMVAEISGKWAQGGIVSWGPGCGLRRAVGVYASVAHFSGWIRDNVPDAYFIGGSATVTASSTPAAYTSLSPTLDACGFPAQKPSNVFPIGLIEGERIAIGAPIHIQLTAPANGALMLFSVNKATCHVDVVEPNSFSASRIVSRGESVVIPAFNGPITIRAKAPAGPSRLYAMVLPVGVSPADLARNSAALRQKVIELVTANPSVVASYDYAVIP